MDTLLMMIDREKRLPAIALLLMLATMLSAAPDYTDWLTASRGFVEVKSNDGLTGDARYCYLLAAAEDEGLYVGVGRYEAKPAWAGEQTRALRYRSAEADPVYDLTNFFTIERRGDYIGLRNLVYDTDLFQTHDEAGYMYVNTFTDKVLDEWSSLTPTFQGGYWLLESGKYPLSSGNWACGYMGPWNNRVAEGEALALNRRNTSSDAAGHYRIFRIAKVDLRAAYEELWSQVDEHNPLDFTWRIANPSFETGDGRGWLLEGREEGNDEFAAREYGMTLKDGRWLMNAYQWWTPSLGVAQTVERLPRGEYELRAVLCTWEGRTVTLTANGQEVQVEGIDDHTGIPVSLDLSVGADQRLDIRVESTAQWWEEGHDGEKQTFFKLDDVRLYCKGLSPDDVTPWREKHQGTLTVCALNVDGLPNKVAMVDLNPDGPGEQGTKKISQYLASKDYDLIGVSEDFNYHGSLMESLRDTYSSGQTRASLSIGGLSFSDLLSGKLRFDTDGLNLLWKNETTSALNESWTQWSSMEATDGNQYIKKGYRHYDVSLGEGIPSIDVYVLHMDAGDEAVWSREAQWAQLAEAVNNSDHSRAKIILGDTNSRWTREEIKSNFVLDSDLTMGDAWVELCMMGHYPTTAMDPLMDNADPYDYTRYEVVDKVIYVNSQADHALRLSPQSFRIETDYSHGTVDGTDDATPLGDHRPVVVTFSYLYLGDELVDAVDQPVQETAAQGARPVAACYTLDGRRVQQGRGVRKGIYLDGGRKVVK